MKNIILNAIETLRLFCLSKMDVALWPNGPTGHDYWMGLSRRNTDGTGRGSFVDQITAPQDVAVLVGAMEPLVTPPCPVRHARPVRAEDGRPLCNRENLRPRLAINDDAVLPISPCTVRHVFPVSAEDKSVDTAELRPSLAVNDYEALP